MQLTLFGILIPVAVIVAGTLVAILMSKSKSQKEAVGVAFASLLVIWLLFFLIAVLPEKQFTVPYFVAAGVIVPIGLYFLLMRHSKKREITKEDKLSGDDFSLKKGLYETSPEPIETDLPQEAKITEKPKKSFIESAPADEPEAGDAFLAPVKSESALEAEAPKKPKKRFFDRAPAEEPEIGDALLAPVESDLRSEAEEPKKPKKRFFDRTTPEQTELSNAFDELAMSDERVEMDQPVMRKQPPSEQIPYNLDFLIDESLEEVAAPPDEKEPVSYEQLVVSLPSQETFVVPEREAVIDLVRDTLFEPVPAEEPAPQAPIIEPIPAVEPTPESVVVQLEPETVAPFIPRAIPTYTPEPVAPYTPEPVAPYTPEPVAPYTPEPVAPYTPQPVAPYTPEPVAPYTPEPVFEYAREVVVPQPQTAAQGELISVIQSEKIQPASANVSYVNCYQKAEAMAKRGMWPISAVLFEESALMADSSEERNRSLFSAINSYIKAKKNGDARRLVGVLQEDSDLSPAHAVKLQAVSKMLK